MNRAANAYLYGPEDGDVRWMGDTSTRFLATGDLTGSAFGLVDEKAKRGVSVPLHKHDQDIEAFFVLEGALTLFLGHEPGRLAAAGAFACVPGGTIHGFRVESQTARYLILTTPRHARFYHAITSPSPGTAIEGKLIQKACQEFGIDFIGPLPD